MPEIAAPRGTHDILPADASAWRWLLDAHRGVVESFGYQHIESPIFESTELFARGVGSDTDVVQKEMFSFEDRGGRSLTLRPEGTAGVVRAVLGARLDQEIRPLRVHYAGAFFRAERPQRGRYHQFTQVGVECIGERSAALDVEVIEMAQRYFDALHISGLQLQLNSLGDANDRAAYRAALVEYYTPLESQLCDDCRQRLRTNPLRLLDCKKDARFVAAAPRIWESLSAESRRHFETVQAGLAAAGIAAHHNHRLVRGLDYYTDTLFEFWHESLQGAQNALGGGGRYDGLAETLGFAPTPGIGYALGVDRIQIIAGEQGVLPAGPGAADVVVCSVHNLQEARAAVLARELRGGGLRVVLDVLPRKLDRKLRMADRLGARVAVILGEDEVSAGAAKVRDLTAHAEQLVAAADLLDYVRDKARSAA